jgi:hypothetical protein
MTTFWTRLRGALNPALPDGWYTAYDLGAAEHVATTRLSVPALRETLRMGGYERQRLSAAKRHPQTGQLHDLSMRRVPDEHPDAVRGTRITAWPARACQFHVHAFRLDTDTLGPVTWVGSHYELRPDFFRPRPSVQRLHEHYKPEYGQTYHRGVTDVEGLPV